MSGIKAEWICTLYSSLNVKELLAWNRRNIWSLSNSNRIQSLNHLAHKRTPNLCCEYLSIWCIWLYVIWLYVCHVMYGFQSESTVQSIVAWMSRNLLTKGAKSVVQYRSVIWPVWLNGWVFVHEVCNYCENPKQRSE